MQPKQIPKKLTYRINGCLFKVYNTLGNIWKEEAYEKALELELQSQGLKAESQKEYDVFYFEKNIGRYRLDLLVEDQVIIEIKVAPEITPLHQAQLISYLKGFDKPIGILANFGGMSMEHQTFPNITELKNPIRDDFDFDKITLPGKEKIKDLLFIANRILTSLGTGYFHQIYRRAFYYELKSAGVEFEIAREITAEYQNTPLDSKKVNFFVIGDLLLSTVAVKKLDKYLLSRFKNHITFFRLKRGLIFNFNALCLDFMYSE